MAEAAGKLDNINVEEADPVLGRVTSDGEENADDCEYCPKEKMNDADGEVYTDGEEYVADGEEYVDDGEEKPY